MTESNNNNADWKVDTSKPVLVTGATGYVAGVLIQQLLEHGVTVHAAVRDPSNKDKLEHLTKVAEQFESKGGSIKFFRGDLLEKGSYEDGMKGCSVVFHTASPFVLTVKDPQKELVTPAVEGTKNVLNSVNNTESVERVVLTSSVVAIFSDASDTYKAPNGVLTEEVINMTSSLDYQPYAFSKTMAEMTAWQIAGSQTRWSMTTINPSFVLGPGLKHHETSESFKAVIQLGGGELSAGVPRISMGVVDVRDVAHAHIAAAYKSGVTGRHILNGHNTDFVQMADTLREKYSDYPLPARILPKTLMWMIGPYVAGVNRRFVSNNLDIDINLDNSKSKRELGIEYKPMKTTMEDMFQQLVDLGAVKKA